MMIQRLGERLDTVAQPLQILLLLPLLAVLANRLSFQPFLRTEVC